MQGTRMRKLVDSKIIRESRLVYRMEAVRR